MNHDETNPPTGSTDAELEARIVAWVAGEASPFEIAELEKIVQAHPELAIFKRRIEAVHGLLGEAARPEQVPLQLSAERRTKLLQAIGVPAPTASAPEVASATLSTLRARDRRRQIWLTVAAACGIFAFSIFSLKHTAENEAKLEASAALARKVREEKIAQENIPKRKLVEEALVAQEVRKRSRSNGTSLLLENPTIVTDNALAQSLELPSAKFDAPLYGAGGVGGRLDNPRSVPSNAPRVDPQPVVKMDPFTVTANSDVGFVAANSLAGGRIQSGLPESLLPKTEFSLSGGRVAGGGGGVGAKSDSERQYDQYAFTPPPTSKPAAEAIKMDPLVVNVDQDVGFVASSSLSGGRLATTPAPNRGFSFSGGLVGTQVVSDDQAKQLVVTTNESADKNRGFLSGLFGRNNASDEKKAKADVAPGALANAAEPSVRLDAFTVSATNDPNFVSSQASTGARFSTALKDTPVAYSVITKEFTDSFTGTGTNANKRAEADAARPIAPKPTTLDTERAGQQSLELSTAQEPISTFSLHVSDVSFRLAAAAFARGEAPDASRIRPEEFYNAFDYGDPTPAAVDKIGCKIEQSAHPVLQQRNLLRIAMKVPSTGRGASTPLRLTVLLDTSGSMEREDRAASVRRAFEVLVSLLGPNDRITLIGFARQPRLMAEDLAGNEARSLLALLARTPADGGTNLEEALALASQLAQRHRLAGAQNRVVLLTDGAANLGNANPVNLAERVTALRQAGIAFDACGVGLSGIDDDVLEALTRQGDGRYYVLNSPEAADSGFARQLAGAFRPAAENVKVQVRFNPARVAHQRLIGFEQHRLATEDFRNDAVDAAELAADEAAVALYQIEVLPQGTGEVGEVFVRFRDPATSQMIERSWTIAYETGAPAFGRATPSLQLAGTAALLAEKLRHSTLGEQLKLGDFARVIENVRQSYPAQPRVQEFVTMFGQARRMFRE